MSEIVCELAKYIGLWFIAGFIVTIICVIAILLSGNFVESISELTIMVIIEALPFPFNLLAGWAIDPVSVVIELILQIVIFAILLYFIEHHS
ncbi:MAG: hypothetical protein QXZ25_01065 [Candidatus Bathyarchaeia archaeon]